MSGRREKSKDDTWGEKELSKHIGKNTGSRKPAAYGSPKTQPKVKSSRDAAKKPSAGQSSSFSSSRRADPKATSSRDKSNERGQKSSGEHSKKQDSKSTSKSGKKDSATGTFREHRSDGTQSKRTEKSRGDGSQPKKTDKTSNSQTKSDGRGQSESRQRNADPSHRSGDKRRTQADEGGRSSKSKESSERGHSDRSGVKQQQHRDGRTSDRHQSSKERESGTTRKSRDSKDKHHSNSDKHKKNDDSKSKIVVREEPPSDDIPQEVQQEDIEGGVANGGPSEKYEGNFPQEMIEVTEELAAGDYEYDDEFEEYDEDFEEEIEEEDGSSEDSESEEDAPTINRKSPVIDKIGKVDLVEIMQAIDAENLMFTNSQSQLDDVTLHDKEEFDDGQTPRRHDNVGVVGRSPSRRFVDFSSAQREEVDKKVARKTRKRGQELLSMIELDIVSFDLFDLPPLSEYEVYVKKFGADDTCQVSVQTGEDNMEGSMQTEPVLTVDKWVQWPPEDLRGYGGGAPGDYDDNEEYSSSKLLGDSALKLVSFLKNAGQVSSVLLEENLSASGQSQSHSTQSQFPFCSIKLQIPAALSILSGRHVSWVYFSPTQEHLFLAAYSTAIDSQSLVNRGLVCLWNTREPTKPYMVLGCESNPTCCCISPQKSSIAFAGNEDGSVVLWDLREPLSMHKTPWSMTGETIIRVPTFSTAGIPQLNNHQAPIVSITPLSAEISDSSSSGPSLSLFCGENDGTSTSSGLSFQLATLDSSCKMNIWVLIELLLPDPHGSESDLGLVPGGRVKLVKSASIDISSPLTRPLAQPLHHAAGLMQAYCVQFQPQDTNHVYVGSDTGCVYHHTRYGRRPIPRCYLPAQKTGGAPCEVLSLSFSQRQPDHFLVGCSDGSLRLHHTKRAPPLLCWPLSTRNVAIVCVQWVEHCPGVFLVKDADNILYMWDLVQNDAEPVYRDTLKTSVTCCRLTSSPFYKYAVSTLTLAFSDGTLEIHQMKELPQNNSNREQSFEEYLKNIH